MGDKFDEIAFEENFEKVDEDRDGLVTVEDIARLTSERL